MPGAKRARGRPPTFNAMTNAERQKSYRDRQRENAGPKATTTAPVAQYDLKGRDYAAELARIEMLEGELSKANARIQRLENENGMLIHERADAFKANEYLRDQLDLAALGNKNVVEWKAKVQKLDAENAGLRSEVASLSERYVNCVTQIGGPGGSDQNNANIN